MSSRYIKKSSSRIRDLVTADDATSNQRSKKKISSNDDMIGELDYYCVMIHTLTLYIKLAVSY